MSDHDPLSHQSSGCGPRPSACASWGGLRCLVLALCSLAQAPVAGSPELWPATHPPSPGSTSTGATPSQNPSQLLCSAEGLIQEDLCSQIQRNPKKNFAFTKVKMENNRPGAFCREPSGNGGPQNPPGNHAGNLGTEPPQLCPGLWHLRYVCIYFGHLLARCSSGLREARERLLLGTGKAQNFHIN